MGRTIRGGHGLRRKAITPLGHRQVPAVPRRASFAQGALCGKCPLNKNGAAQQPPPKQEQSVTVSEGYARARPVQPQARTAAVQVRGRFLTVLSLRIEGDLPDDRLWAHLDDQMGRTPQFFSGAPVVLDLAAQTVAVGGSNVDLTSYEYKVLEYLMMHAGELVSKADLTEHIYQQDFDRDSNVLEVFIGRLRKKLDPDGTLKPIETVRGRGYRFAIPRNTEG